MSPSTLRLCSCVQPQASRSAQAGSDAGARLFRVVQQNVERRNIEVRLECPARKLLRDADGAIVGVDTGDAELRAALAALSPFARPSHYRH